MVSVVVWWVVVGCCDVASGDGRGCGVGGNSDRLRWFVAMM